MKALPQKFKKKNQQYYKSMIGREIREEGGKNNQPRCARCRWYLV